MRGRFNQERVFFNWVASDGIYIENTAFQGTYVVSFRGVVPARGSSMRFSLVGPTKVKACKSLMFTEVL